MIGRTHVVDSSAVLALIHGETGRARVIEVLYTSCISSVNWSEVLQKAAQKRLDAALTADGLERMGLTVVAFNQDDAETAAAMWSATKGQGLSLGDRACLALARRLGLPAVTAERAWQSVPVGVSVELIR